MILDCFGNKMQHHCIKMEFQKIVHFLDTTSDDQDLPRFVSKKWIKKEIMISTKKLESKHQF